MVEYLVFWDYLDADGWGEVTSMHRSPHRLDPEAVALGVSVQVPAKPARDGWLVKGWVHPASAAFKWRMTRDASHRVPISEFLASLPGAARVQARGLRNSDPVIGDFMALLDMAASEGRGINPHGPAARDGLDYLVSLQLMTQAQADAITDKAND